jgi:hypothetical protein
MPTLLALYHANTLLGRCDARCYNATSPAATCDCICGGANHGVGYRQAHENSQRKGEAWLESYAQGKGLTGWRGEVEVEAGQLRLF